MSNGLSKEKRLRHPREGAWPPSAWGQHVSGSTSNWTCLFTDNVLPSENAWLPWQLPFQWHSWSPPLTATIRSRSSTPKAPGRDLVSIFPHTGHQLCAGRRARKEGCANREPWPAALRLDMLWGTRGQGWMCCMSSTCWENERGQVLWYC